MELLRSADMHYVSITMANESAPLTIRELGRLGKFHPVDLAGHDKVLSKQAAQYKKRVQDCVYWEKKLGFFKEKMIEYGIPMEDLDISPVSGSGADLLEAAEHFFEPIERDLVMNVQFQKENSSNLSELNEKRHVLTILRHVKLAEEAGFSADEIKISSAQEEKADLLSDVDDEDDLERNPTYSQVKDKKFRTLISGTIAVDQQPLFNRMLYRVSRGNAFARFKDINEELLDPETGKSVKKSVFYVVVLGEQLASRVDKMCSLFRAKIFVIPTKKNQFNNEISLISDEIREKKEVEKRTKENILHLLSQLGSGGDSCVIRDWQSALSEEKAVCDLLTKAHFYLTMVSLEGWIPKENVKELKRAAKNAVSGTGNPSAAVEIDPLNPISLPGVPPSYFPLNKFTSVFQSIVDTYGVPRYKEVNPGLFTIISFPFLFGVMYGDIGHGSLLLLFSLLMIWKEKELQEKERKGTLGEIPSMAFSGRYCLLLMGAFAIYCGVIYNDFMSIPLNVYGSNWSLTEDGEYVSNGKTYPLGIDPGWTHKTNELAFYNSFKMKSAVILGVVQMLFGLSLSLLNHVYFKDYISIWWEFLPRLLFLLSTFGYMIWMILYKWCQDWSVSAVSPPNLIQTMIAMFLSVGSVDPDKQLYEGQAGFQSFLVLVALLSVPAMLLGKPYMHKRKHEREAAQRRLSSSPSASFSSLAPNSPSSPSAQAVPLVVDEEEHEFSFSDEMIHNAIHTIEFVLGCVSNTASYLRLWALSLAHAQLAKVFWEKMMSQYGYEGGSAFIGFAVWAAATFAVLLCMDVLECFLHALRLHWVEFQNKFYNADGKAFEPFGFSDRDAVF